MQNHIFRVYVPFLYIGPWANGDIKNRGGTNFEAKKGTFDMNSRKSSPIFASPRCAPHKGKFNGLLRPLIHS